MSKDSAALLYHLGLQQSSKGKENQNMLNAHTFSIVCKAKIDKITSFISFDKLKGLFYGVGVIVARFAKGNSSLFLIKVIFFSIRCSIFFI